MSNLLKSLWAKWMRLGMTIGDFASMGFLLTFYFTLFAIFAVPFRFFKDPFRTGVKDSSWIPKTKTVQKPEDFKFEF